MLSVSPIKNSPIAKYLKENNVKPWKNRRQNTIEFINKDCQSLGILKKKNNMFDDTQIDIDLYKPKEDTPFLRQRTFITKIQRYFLDEHKFMPVNITTTKILNDFEHNIHKEDTLTRGLASNLYIEKLPESEDLVSERVHSGLPVGYPIFKINKPFKYEFKSHLYAPQKPIDSTKPMIKE